MQGLETVIIGSVMNTLDANVIVRPDIQTVDDMRGKTIGVNRLKAISDVGARLAFKQAGLEPDVDIFTRGTGGNAETLAAMEAGTVDGASFGVRHGAGGAEARLPRDVQSRAHGQSRSCRAPSAPRGACCASGRSWPSATCARWPRR